MREIDGEANVLIGAPSHQDTGALYNCNVYGKCQDFDAGKNYVFGHFSLGHSNFRVVLLLLN